MNKFMSQFFLGSQKYAMQNSLIITEQITNLSWFALVSQYTYQSVKGIVHPRMKLIQ